MLLLMYRTAAIRSTIGELQYLTDKDLLTLLNFCITSNWPRQSLSRSPFLFFSPYTRQWDLVVAQVLDEYWYGCSVCTG